MVVSHVVIVDLPAEDNVVDQGSIEWLHDRGPTQGIFPGKDLFYDGTQRLIVSPVRRPDGAAADPQLCRQVLRGVEVLFRPCAGLGEVCSA